MSAKPSYIGLLNAIAVGEARGAKIFNAWSKICNDPLLAPVLKHVALREREHAASFSKRLCELGFDLRVKPNEDFDQKLRQVSKDGRDLKKFRKVLKFHKDSSANDPLTSIFQDTTIDIQTATLLGRFIAEERDSNRLLREQYNRLCRVHSEKNTRKDSSTRQNASAQSDDTVALLYKRLDRLTETLEDIKSLKAR